MTSPSDLDESKIAIVFVRLESYGSHLCNNINSNNMNAIIFKSSNDKNNVSSNGNSNEIIFNNSNNNNIDNSSNKNNVSSNKNCNDNSNNENKVNSNNNNDNSNNYDNNDNNIGITISSSTIKHGHSRQTMRSIDATQKGLD